MTLNDIANVGQLVNGVAVLATLVFLAVQMRQTHLNQHALITQGMTTRNTELVRALSEPQVSDLQTRVRSGDTEFEPAEIWQLQRILRVLVNTVVDTQTLRRFRLVQDFAANDPLNALKAYLAQPVYRALWRIDVGRGAYAPEIVSFVEELIAQIPLAPPQDILGQFRDALAVTMAEGNWNSQ